MRTPLQRLCLLVVASSFYTFSVNGGIISGSELVDYVAGYGPPYFATLWVARDAQRTNYWPAYHYGLFLFLFWFIAIPHYLVHTRGRSGIRLAVGLLLLLAISPASGVAGWWLYEFLPDFR